MPARLINIKYITIRAEKVASPVTALHSISTVYSIEESKLPCNGCSRTKVIASLSTTRHIRAWAVRTYMQSWIFLYKRQNSIVFLRSAPYYWRYFWKHSDTIPYVICCYSVVFHLLKCSYANGLCLECILLVFGRCAFAVLRSTCSWWVTTYVGKPSAIGQPTRPTQPFIVSGR